MRVPGTAGSVNPMARMPPRVTWVWGHLLTSLGSPLTGTDKVLWPCLQKAGPWGGDICVVPFCQMASAHLSGQKVKLGVTLHTSWALGKKATKYQSPALSLAKWPRLG